MGMFSAKGVVITNRSTEEVISIINNNSGPIVPVSAKDKPEKHYQGRANGNQFYVNPVIRIAGRYSNNSIKIEGTIHTKFKTTIMFSAGWTPFMTLMLSIIPTVYLLFVGIGLRGRFSLIPVIITIALIGIYLLILLSIQGKVNKEKERFIELLK